MFKSGQGVLELAKDSVVEKACGLFKATYQTLGTAKFPALMIRDLVYFATDLMTRPTNRTIY